MKNRQALLLVGLMSVTTGHSTAAAQTLADSGDCNVAALTRLAVPDLTVTSAAPVAATVAAPAYCDVKGTVATHGEGAAPGAAGFAARLPANWNGKFLASAAGALSGSLVPLISNADLAASLAKGYAFVTSDGGHTGGFFDGSWSLTAPGVPADAKLADYLFRATHQVTVAVKELVKAFYRTDTISRAYFDGCSNGGRNGLMAAMRYPDDYDGIIAGAPYMDIRVNLAGYKNSKAFLNAYIPPPLISKIDAAVRASCDGADGVVDGLIQNPADCSFDPDTLVPGVLTAAQADGLKTYFSALTDTHGKPVFPGQSVSDLGATGPFGGFLPWIVAGPPVDPVASQPWASGAPFAWQAADAVLRYMVELDPSFNSNLEWPQIGNVIDKEALKRFDRMTERGSTDDPMKLAAFFAGGRKLILYHGFSDPALSPFRTTQFHEELARGAHGSERARLFMVPGMAHCSGGPGPNSFDTLTALETWVESGAPPDAIVATHFVNNNPALGIDRTMPLCPYPAQARYVGPGAVNEASSWRCSVPQVGSRRGATMSAPAR